MQATKTAAGAPGAADAPPAGWLAPLAVLLIALMVRVAYLAESRDSPTFLFPVVDAYAYDALARKLASGLPAGDALFWQPLLYPHFLAGMYALFGHGIWAAKIVQAVIGVATCMLTFGVGYLAMSRGVGLVAGVIMALYGPVIFFESELLAEGLALFWTLSLVLLFMLADRPGPPRLFFALGFCGILATLTRPPLLVFFLGGCLVLAIRLRKRTSWRELALRALLVAVGFGILASYVAVLTHARTGHFGILPSSNGINLYIGNNPRWKETLTARPDRSWKAITDLPREQGIYDPWRQSRFFQRKVLRYVREEPAAFIEGLLLKAVRFFNSRELPRNVDIYVFRRWSCVLSILTWKIGPYGFPFGLIWPLAVLGFATSWRRVPYPLWVLVTTYPAAIILYFVSSRYRILVVPCLTVMAAAGGLQLRSSILGRRWRQLAPSLSLVLCVAIASSLPREFPEETASVSYEAELYRQIGRTRFEEGHYLDAIHYLNEALALNPALADAWNDLGASLLRQGKYDEAIPYLERAIALDPSVALYSSNLGLAYLEKGDLQEAERRYRRAVDLDPESVSAQLNLGICLFRQKELEEAIERSKAVLRQYPNHPKARALLYNAIQSQRNEP